MLPLTENWAYQNSPTTVPMYLRVRNRAYAGLDMTLVTRVVCEVYLPGAGSTSTTWTFNPVVSETTTDVFVGLRYMAAGDTDKIGKITIIPTPWIGLSPVVPARPVILPVKQRAPL